jgi:hypothetical protein
MAAIKIWQTGEDSILAMLCRMMTERKLYKTILSSDDLSDLAGQKKEQLIKKHNITKSELQYFMTSGVTSNDTYNVADERIQIAMKNGAIVDISEIDNPIVNKALAMPIHKNYICYVNF